MDYTYYTHGFIVKIQPSRTHNATVGKNLHASTGSFCCRENRCRTMEFSRNRNTTTRVTALPTACVSLPG